MAQVLKLVAAYVTIRPGRAYDGLTPPIQDCFSKDKTIKAVRIETAICDDEGQEIRRAAVRTCSKTDKDEQVWVYNLDDDGVVLSKEQQVTCFDEHGRQSEHVVRTWAEGSLSAARYQSRYDAESRLVEIRNIDEDGTTNTVEYALDNRGDAAGYYQH